jgi:uncharacterized protein YsxB (DUF464 family)
MQRMTNIKVIMNKSDIVGIEVSGHAAYSFDGKDIVCSAISALSFNLAIGLFEVICYSENEVEYKESEALMSISFKDYAQYDIDRYSKAQTLLKAFKLSVENIQEQYTNNVKVEVISNENI